MGKTRVKRCSSCIDSRRIRIEGRPYYFCEKTGAFKTLSDKCDLEEVKPNV